MTGSQRALAAFFTFAGIMHFVIPRSYEAAMPPYLPLHRESVIVSGIAEIAGGLAVIPPSTRSPFARWWLIALLVAVFPANVHMAVNPDQVRGLDKRIPRVALWLRLPVQALLVYWVYRATEE
jgi:uncharacterized membrane protein